MNIWKILGIDETIDTGTIKKAYRTQLKTTRPDDDGDAFMRLRAAYEEALEYAEENALREDDIWEDNTWEDDTRRDDILGNASQKYYTQDDQILYGSKKTYSSQNSHKETYDEDNYQWEQQLLKEEKLTGWNERIDQLYHDYDRRNQVSQWKAMLWDDIPYQIEYYEECKKYIYQLIYERYKRIYLPREVRIFIDGFFSYSRTPMIRAKINDDGERKELMNLNRRIKLCENIEFDKLKLCGDKDISGGIGRSISNDTINGIVIDEFLYGYEQIIYNLHDYISKDNMKAMEDEIGRLRGFSLTYLPL